MHLLFICACFCIVGPFIPSLLFPSLLSSSRLFPSPILPPPNRAIAHGLLEKVDRYLWSPRPNSLPPQLLHVHTREKQQQQTEERPDTTIFPSVVECSSTLEDASSHWGVRSKQEATCGKCRLHLLTSVSDLQPGIIAFCCGEYYQPEETYLHCYPRPQTSGTLASILACS